MSDLAQQVVAKLSKPQSQQIDPLRPLLDCQAPSQSCVMLELEPQATEAAAALGAAINESPLKNDSQAVMVGQMIADLSEGDDDPGWNATLGDIQTTGPDTATINITASDQEFGMTIPPSFSAHRTGGGWKIVNLPNPSGQQHTPEAMRSLVAGLRDMTAKVKSGEISSGAELQQAAMSLMAG